MTRIKKHITLVLSAVFCLAPIGAWAQEMPHAGQYDKRIRNINYNPAQVVKLVGHYGFSTDIEFGPGEHVTHIAIGDKGAWTVAPTGHHLFIKPKGNKATTNMTVITNRHVYQFVLIAFWSNHGAKPGPNGMMFQVVFHYPKAKARQAQAAAKSKALQKRLDDDSNLLPENWNYWAEGSPAETPDKVWDDGLFTYLHFPAGASMPAIYIVNADGSESLVNTHINPNHPSTIVVDTVARHLVLRKGHEVTCIFNRSYSASGVPNKTDTTIPGVQRIVKGDH
jgi:type IV secretion system protein VirB9